MPVPVRIDVDGPVEDLPPGMRALIYFFCSECLANTAKHAAASAAAVCVNTTGGRLAVSVHDDGRGGVSLADPHQRRDPGSLIVAPCPSPQLRPPGSGGPVCLTISTAMLAIWSLTWPA
ncbi:MAG TPA: hypothetical protein VGH88_10200 [Streptosporangiaceae bacterium]|jgi:anti-sigma regulatory factor (Ser/Thr protein kinase)